MQKTTRSGSQRQEAGTGTVTALPAGTPEAVDLVVPSAAAQSCGV